MDPSPPSDARAPTGPAPKAPRLGIPTRIFLAFATVVLSFGIVSVVSVVQHQRSAATLRLLHEGYIPLALAIGNLRAAEANFTTAFERLADGTRSDATTRWLGAARSVRPTSLRRAFAGVDRADALSLDARDREVFAALRLALGRVEREYQESEPDIDTVLRAFDEGRSADTTVALEALEGRQSRIALELRESLSSLEQRIADASLAAADAESRSIVTIAFLGLAALLAGAFVTWWARGLLRPLPALEERVLAVARGDLSRRLEPGGERDDEIGRLAREFERMVDALATRDQRLRDVAEALRELQKMQEQIVASLRAAVVVVGDDGGVRAANAAARTILGGRETSTGASVRRSGLLQRVPGLGEAIEAVAQGAAPRALAAVRLAGEGETTVDVLVTPFGDAADAATGRAVLVVADDVTEALRTKERLLKSERLAAMGRMAAHVTHEVRNPLSSIGLNVELLADELHGKREAEELLRAIQREVDRLTAITEEYLRVARLPAPLLSAESAGELTLAATRFVEREMSGAGVTIETTIAPELPTLLLDEAQFRQALLNLLRNAREAMPGGGRIEVRVRPEAGGVVIEVADEGTGIPPEGKERIFDLFFSTKEKGTGLGLTLTREIVVAHGGRLEVHDASPKGTVFSIWLPRAAPAPAPEGRAAA